MEKDLGDHYPKMQVSKWLESLKCSVCFRFFGSTISRCFFNSNSHVCFHFSKGLLRCGKSCRLRWINYLRADLKRGNITAEEEETIVKLHSSLGNRYVQPLKIACISGIF